MSGYYFTPEGLQQVALFESSNNPTAQNPSSTASGLYGFTNSTWVQYAETYSPGLSAIYPTAASAPSSVQTAVAQITPSSNWTCPGCDASISTAVQSDPSLLSSTPITAAVDSTTNPDYSGGTTGTGSFLDSLNPFSSSAIANDPNNPGGTGTGAQSPVGSVLGALGSSPSSWFQTAFTYIENLFARGGLMLLAIVMITLGLIFVLKDDTTVGRLATKAVKMAAE
jgi:Transglycosylase-like domain